MSGATFRSLSITYPLPTLLDARLHAHAETELMKSSAALYRYYGRRVNPPSTMVRWRTRRGTSSALGHIVSLWPGTREDHQIRT